MALRPPWYRLVLAAPVSALVFISFVLGIWAPRRIGHVCSAMIGGSRRHVWHPLVILQRWVAGVPTWNFDDLVRFGLQPRTSRQRELALADKRLEQLNCTCDSPTCEAKNGRLFTVRIAPAEFQRMAAEFRRDMDAIVDAEIKAAHQMLADRQRTRSQTKD